MVGFSPVDCLVFASSSLLSAALRLHTACEVQRPMLTVIPRQSPLYFLVVVQAANRSRNNVPAGHPATAAATATPAPASAPPSADGGGGGGGRRVSVSEIFRLCEKRFEMRNAASVGRLAKKMYVQECGKPAGKALRKRPVLDAHMNEVPCGWPPFIAMENAYPSCYRGMLQEAFDTVLGR